MDARNYADYWGGTVEDAATILSRQEQIGSLAKRLEAEMPPWFAGVWIEHHPYQIVVGYVGPRDQAMAAVHGTELDPFISFRQRDASLSDLLTTMAEARKVLAPEATHVEIDLLNGRVVVSVLSNHRVSAALDDVVGRDDLLDLREVPPEIQRFGESGIDIYGGLDSSNCTWGFTVRKTTDPSVTGIMTAGHCANANTYQGVNLPYQSGTPDSPVSGNKDAQWSTTPGIVDRNWVIDNANGHTRVITARKPWANVVVGTTVCKYGRTTHYTCGEVISKTDAPPWIQNASAVWLKVGRQGVIMSDAGDSGGPLFIGGTAYGINQGHYFEWFGTADGVFGSITYQEFWLGVQVKVN